MAPKPEPISVSDIADRVLHELVDCYFAGTDFFMGDRVSKFLKNHEDAIFITDEEIIDTLKRKLADKYCLEVTDVMRTLITHTPENDFDYADTKLEIKLKHNND
jgi:hypothetical protein